MQPSIFSQTAAQSPEETFKALLQTARKKQTSVLHVAIERLSKMKEPTSADLSQYTVIQEDKELQELTDFVEVSANEKPITTMLEKSGYQADACLDFVVDALKEELWSRSMTVRNSLTVGQLEHAKQVIAQGSEQIKSVKAVAEERGDDSELIEQKTQKARLEVKAKLSETADAAILPLVTAAFDSLYETLAKRAASENPEELALRLIDQALWDQIPAVFDDTLKGLVALLIETAPEDLVDVIGSEEKPGPLSQAVNQRLKELEMSQPKRWIENEWEREKWSSTLETWKKDWSDFENRIRTFPSNVLFSNDPEIRQKQYKTFAYMLEAPFYKLKEADDDNYLFGQLRDIIEHCRTGWHERIQQMRIFSNIETVQDFGLQAHQVARDFRREIILEKVLLLALKGWDEGRIADVHNQLSIRQWANERYALGYSADELGEPESAAVYLSEKFEDAAKVLMPQLYTPQSLYKRLQEAFESLGESEMRRLFISVILDAYRQSYKLAQAPTIDPESIEVAAIYDRLAAIDFSQYFEGYADELKSIVYQLASHGIQASFRTSSYKDTLVAELLSTRLINQKSRKVLSRAKVLNAGELADQLQVIWNDKRKADEALNQQDSTFQSSMERVDYLLKELRLSEEPESQARYKQQQESAIRSFLASKDETLARYNANRLEARMLTADNRLQPFGAAMWACYANLVEPEASFQAPDKTDGALALACLQWAHGLNAMQGATRELLKADGMKLEYLPKSMKKDLSLVEIAMEQNPLAFRFAGKTLRSDPQFALKAIERNRSNIRFVAESLCQIDELQDRFVQIAIEYLKDEPGFYTRMPAFIQKDPRVQALLEERPWAYYGTSEKEYQDLLARTEFKAAPFYSACKWDAPNWTRYCLAIAEKMVQVDPRTIELAGPCLKANEKLVRMAIQANGELFKYASEELRGNRTFVLEAVQKMGQALQWALPPLNEDPEVVESATQQDPLALQFAHERYKKDKAFVLKLIQRDGNVLKYVDTSLQADPDIVQAAVDQNPLTLAYADDSFKKSKAFVLPLIQKNGLVLKYVDASLKEDPEVVLPALEQDPRALSYAGDSFKKSKELVLKLIQKEPAVLYYANESLQDDLEVVKMAIDLDVNAYRHAGKLARNNKALALEAVKKDGSLLLYVSDELKKDKEVALAAIEQSESAYTWMTYELKNDPEINLMRLRSSLKVLSMPFSKWPYDVGFMRRAIEVNPKALQYASQELMNDETLVRAALEKDPLVFEYAGEKIRFNPDMFLLAFNKDLSVICFADESLAENRSVMQVVRLALLQKLQEEPTFYMQLPEFIQNDAKIKERVKSEPWRYYGTSEEEYKTQLARTAYYDVAVNWDAPDWTKCCPDIARRIIRLNPLNLEFAGLNIRCNPSIVSEAALKDNYSLEHASLMLADAPTFMTDLLRKAHSENDVLYYARKLRRDREFMLHAMEIHELTYHDLDIELSSDREFMIQAIRRNPLVFGCCSYKYGNDKQIALEAVRGDYKNFDLLSEGLKRDRDMIKARRWSVASHIWYNVIFSFR